MRAGFAAALAAGLVLLCAGLWLGGHPQDLPGPLRDAFVDDSTALSAEAIDAIEDDYYRPVDADELRDAGVSGIVSDLRKRHREDRFSHYFSPRQAEILREETEGRFSGVGLSVAESRRGLRVIDVFDGAPAAEAGIRVGELIVSVDGKSIAGQPVDLSTAKIKGEAGTEVTLGVVRPGRPGPRRERLERAEVATPIVERRLRRVGGKRIGYVKLLGFSRGANEALREAVERLQGRGARGILLDLRGNPGGLLTEAVSTSSVFLPADEVVVTTRGRTEPRRVYRSSGDPVPRRPLVVLIDRGTASAAEILASALADNGLAQIVGTRSFGKGLYQHVIDLSNGGELDLTVGEFFTAGSISLAPKGIKPDVRAADDPRTGADEALRRALAVLAPSVAGPVATGQGG